jgi:hypothetical protein
MPSRAEQGAANISAVDDIAVAGGLAEILAEGVDTFLK